MKQEWNNGNPSLFTSNQLLLCPIGHYNCTPIPTPQHSYVLLLCPGWHHHLNHTVPALCVPHPQLAILVPAKRPQIVALCETHGVSRATAHIYNSTLCRILPTEMMTLLRAILPSSANYCSAPDRNQHRQGLHHHVVCCVVTRSCCVAV